MSVQVPSLLAFHVAGTLGDQGALQGRTDPTPWQSQLSARACSRKNRSEIKGRQDVHPSPCRAPSCRCRCHAFATGRAAENKGRSARVGHPYALAEHLGLRCSAGGFCVAGVALGAPQGVGCTHWRPLVSGGFSWQAWHLMLCKGSDVRPGVPWSPLAFAWQVPHLVLCKGSDVRPGVPWSPLLCRWLLPGRRSTWCSARGRMYALASGVPWSPLLCRWLLHGRRGTWCSARGRMYALASLGLRCSAGGFCVAGGVLNALQDVRIRTPWQSTLCPRLPRFCVAGAAPRCSARAYGSVRPGRGPWCSAALPVAFA